MYSSAKKTIYNLDYLSENLFESQHSIDEAISILNTMRENKQLLAGNFNDFIWSLRKDETSNTSVNINFSKCSKFKEISICLKCWCSSLLVDLNAETVRDYVHKVITIIDFTNGFEEEKIEDTVNYLEDSLSKTVRVITLRLLFNFLDYSDIHSKEMYMNELSIIKNKYKIDKNVRELPDFQSVLLFNSIIDDFQLNWNDNEKLLYYPIVLWWKITNIIPLRPNEFCLIARDCISKDNGSYYLTVPRKKQKATKRLVEIVDTLEINEEVYNLIYNYIQLTEPFGKSNTLISYAAYNKMLNNRRGFINYAPLYFNYMNLTTLLLLFYEEIIRNKYMMNDLDKIKPNDTRHFAFCSMMLQGFDSLTIARIGGHRSVESQYHYQQHMDYFIESKVYTLTKMYQMQNKYQFNNISASNTSSLIERSDHFVEMDYGYCTDPNMDCESDICQLCTKWWISKDDLKKHIKELEDLANNKSNKIKERLLFIENLRKSMEYNTELNTSNPLEKEKLAREVKLLNGEIEDLARIKSKL